MIIFKSVYHVATMNDARERLSGVDVLVEGNRIARIGRGLQAPWGARAIECSSMLMLPGFVNLHHHFYQTLQRNVPAAQNRKLFDWLTTL
ncbi:MAG: 8-oxoguanine deaminase, partial [Candidatus Eisenbacteria bacterium]|nr:8-oxoguanine deaminase [Candidatus Eisenbacteria bacterium]